MIRRSSSGSIALVLVAAFVVALFAVHLTEPEMNFGPVSLYSLGPFGLVMRLGFLALGAAFFALAWGPEKSNQTHLSLLS